MNSSLEIEILSEKYVESICDIAYDQYKEEEKYNSCMQEISRKDFFSSLKEEIKGSYGLVAINNNKVVGYFLCKNNYFKEGINYFYFPQWGYGCVGENRSKIMSHLFKKFAMNIKGKAHFEIKLYAHDEEIIRSFSFMQFGIECEQCISRVLYEEFMENGVIYREMESYELQQRWQEVWSLLSSLIRHLQKSPIFYPGEEFTEEVYKEFFMESDTNVFIAEKSGRLVGIIETNSGANDILTRNIPCSNIGDVYVHEEYRGLNIAHNLLFYANKMEKKKGTEFLWVEHGTANPNARGFWNKYFEPYVYTMIRDIEVL